MRPADDDSQTIAAPDEAPETAPLEGAEELAPLPELEVIGAAVETADDAADDTEAQSKEKPRSARERLNSRTREARPRKKRGPLIAAILLLILLIAAIGTAVGGIAYLRWYANDDALDFQGTWYVAGTETPIEITADSIQLTESVAYRYKLNTHDKTITLTLGNMTGHGSYRFSLDRTQLVIFDGQSDPNTILEADVRWLVKALYDDFMEEENDVTTGIRRNRTLLTREPNTSPLSAASTNSESPSSASSSAGSEEPHTVWSAEEWLSRENESSDDSGNADSAGASSTASDVNDVDSLLQGINDLPANDATAPESAPAPEDAAL